MNSNFPENLIRSISKYIFAVPVVILAVGFYMRYSGNTPTADTVRVVAPTLSGNKTNAVLNNVASDSAIFNLEGPLACHAFTEGGLVDAYAADGNILLQKQGKSIFNFLLNDDCAYSWENGKFTGEKFCGLRPYIAMFKTFFSGELSPRNLQKVLDAAGVTGLSGSESAGLQSVLQSCRKQQITDKSIFVVPQKIIFRNMPLNDLLK